MSTAPLLDDGTLIATSIDAPEPLMVVDLLEDLDGLATHLRHELAAKSWLNAYLLAAGMNQIAEDHLNAHGYVFGKVADHVARAPAPLGHLGEQAVRALSAARLAIRALAPANRRAAAWQVDVAALVACLANIVIAAKPNEDELGAAELLGGRVVRRCSGLAPALRRVVVRLPSCFRSFDQRPRDMMRLVSKVKQQGVAPTTPIAAVGVRTSGSYLGPIVAASLRTEGFQDVVALTIRPGHPVRARDRATLRNVAGRGGLVLLVDDPPITGGSLGRTAGEISRCGVAPAAMLMLVPLFGAEDSLPPTIRHHRHVLLPWREWSIHDEMTSEAVAASLSHMLGPRLAVIEVERLSAPPPSGERGHVEGRFRIRLSGLDDGIESARIVHVASVGLGYFGEHSLAVAKRLTGFVPEVYGLHNGLLFRRSLPAEQRVAPERIASDAERLRPFLNYVRARSVTLAVAEDTSQRLRGRLPVWEAASNILSRAFGRGWALARLPLVDHVVRCILAVDKPAVVDGSMGLGSWFDADRPTNGVVKIDFDRRAFSNFDLYSYDPTFDVASLAADLEFATHGLHPAVRPEQLRDSWADMAGQSISAERWFLLQLVHLWDRQRTDVGRELDFSRALARASQRYFSELFLEGKRPATRGPLCALDVDGVLETEGLGFSSLSASSAIALRALLAHGYRPLLVTGRSLVEVRDRCSAFGLAGGVAEYGSAFYDHELNAVVSLVTDAQLRDLERVRQAIGALEAIRVDDAYQHSVRVYRFGDRGQRVPPPAGLVDQVLDELGLRDSVKVHTGDTQVDLVAAGIDKGRGLKALATHLGVDPEAIGGRPVALAVGDGAADIPMFRLAQVAAVPAHAHASVRLAAGRTMPRPYQAGLADAVAVLLEHRPGSCSVCAGPVLQPTSRAVVSLLSAQERGVRSMVMAALGLAMARGRLGHPAASAVGASGSPPEATASRAAFGVAGMMGNPVARLVAHARTPLYGNGYALIISTGITSALGLAYWGLAARLYSTDAVGFNAAIISAMMFLAGLAQLNLMSALLRFMPEAGRQSVRLIVVAYGISVVVAGLASVVFGQSIGIWVPRLAAIGSSPSLLLWFTVATIAWCIFVLEDSAITGLRRTIWVPISNAGFSAAKIVLLVLLAAALPFYGVFASWTIALAASILLTNALLFVRLLPRHAPQARSAGQGLSVGTVARYVAPDYVGSIFWLASTTLLPIIVAQEVGLRATAFFYLAWQIGYALCTVSMNMGYSLMVEAAADPHSLPAYSRRVLLLIMRIVVPAAILVAFGAQYVMRVFGADYAREGANLLSLLSLAAIPFSVVSLYVSVARVQRRVRQAAVVLAFMCCLVLGLSEVFLRLMGLPGVGFAWLLSQVVVGSIVFAWQIWPLWVGADKAGGPTGETGSLRIDLEPLKVGSPPFRKVARGLYDHYHQLQFRRETELVAREILSSLWSMDGLSAPRTWVVKRIVSVDIDRAVVAVGPHAIRDPVAIFKLSRNAEAAKNIGRQKEALAALTADSRLADLMKLVPTELASGSIDSCTYVVERALPGVDARLVLSDRDRRFRMHRAAIQTVGLLHQRTAKPATVDQALVKRWIDGPLCLIQSLGAAYPGIAANASAVERLGATLSESLIGRQLVVSWVHGDFWPGNILVSADGGAVTGLIDWDLAAPDDLPLLDIVQLLLGTHLARAGSELGPVVRNLLNGIGFGRSELQMLAATQMELGGDELSFRELVLLSWLRHVSCNLTKSSLYGRHRWWVKENVEGVLDSLPR